MTADEQYPGTTFISAVKAGCRVRGNLETEPEDDFKIRFFTAKFWMLRDNCLTDEAKMACSNVVGGNTVTVLPIHWRQYDEWQQDWQNRSVGLSADKRFAQWIGWKVTSTNGLAYRHNLHREHFAFRLPGGGAAPLGGDLFCRDERVLLDVGEVLAQTTRRLINGLPGADPKQEAGRRGREDPIDRVAVAPAAKYYHDLSVKAAPNFWDDHLTFEVACNFWIYLRAVVLIETNLDADNIGDVMATTFATACYHGWDNTVRSRLENRAFAQRYTEPEPGTILSTNREPYKEDPIMTCNNMNGNGPRYTNYCCFCLASSLGVDES